MIAVACRAAGFAAVDHPPGRRRGLLWFAAGHTVILLVVLTLRPTPTDHVDVESAARFPHPDTHGENRRPLPAKPPHYLH